MITVTTIMATAMVCRVATATTPPSNGTKIADG